jgi:acetyltransferase
MSRTRVMRLLEGYRDRAPAALDMIARALVAIAQIAADQTEVVELDINPLLADAQGVVALDARIRIDPGAVGRGSDRFAIRPYPDELAETIEIATLGRVALRAIRPEDAGAITALFERLSPEDVRMRFFAAMRELPREMLVRLTQIDYDREMALVLETPPGGIGAVVRIACDPDNVKAEFAIVVRSDLKGQGIGTLLMGRILDHARKRGVQEVWGDVLRENRAMLQLARELGFAIEDVPETGEIVRVRVRL